MRQIFIFVCLFALGYPHSSFAGECKSPDSFSGDVVVRWLEDPDGPDREMKLEEDFSYCDPAGLNWYAPLGTKIDGASIPRVVWTSMGSPFVGDYRWASVIHDHYCDSKERSWEETHLVFYHAMIRKGVSKTRAKLFYAAVYAGGPRWAELSGAEPGGPKYFVENPEYTLEDFKRAEKWIKSDDPTIEEITRRYD